MAELVHSKRLEHEIEMAVEAESERLDTMFPQSIGAYNKCVTDHIANIVELEEKLEIEKALLYMAQNRLKQKWSSVAFDLGYREDFIENGEW